MGPAGLTLGEQSARPYPSGHWLLRNLWKIYHQRKQRITTDVDHDYWELVLENFEKKTSVS